jgi:hypothetical protein
LNANPLVTRLLLPLTLAFILSVVLHRQWGWDGFFINLSTTIIDIAVTVFYVDYVLKKFETDKYLGSRKRTKIQLKKFVKFAFNNLRGAVGQMENFEGYKWEFILRQMNKISPENLNRVRGNMQEIAFQTAETILEASIEFAKNHLEPETREKIFLFSPKEWLQFERIFSEIENQVDSIFIRHGSQLEPDEYEFLLEIQAGCERIR